MINRILLWFERWIDPFRSISGRPPPHFFPYVLFFVKQAPLVFVLALFMGGILGFVEIMLFNYVGDIVDALNVIPPAELFDRFGPSLLWMAFFVVVIRLGFMTFGTILDEQVIVPSFFNLVRWQNHQYVMRQSVSFFQNDFAGRIAQKVTQSGQSLGDFLMSLLQVIWLFLIYVIGSMALFAGLHWQLVAVLLIWAVFYAAIIYTFIPRIRKAARAFSEAQATVNGRLVDGYSNIMLVKMDGEESREDRFIADGIGDFVAKIRVYTRNITLMRFSLHLINAAMVVGVGYIALGLWQVSAVTIGAVALALGLMLRLTILATRMLGQFNSIFRAVGTIQNTLETVTKPISLLDTPDAVVMPRARGEITLKDVHFRYEENERPEVVDGVSLTIKPGERIGLVGPSGAGKSTLFNLILRLHDVQKGTIMVDGFDVSKVTQASLRANFGLVMQETALLNRSVRENIAFPKPDAADEEIEQAAGLAKAHEFIVGLADGKGRTGYDVHVGERGVKLSGGQRQRLALARVVLKDAPILMLDEATSALDSETEAAIQAELETVMDGKTVLAIAHRLSTIRSMDRLVVMENGRIVEDGSHDDLIRHDGIYAALWRHQSGGFIGSTAHLAAS